MSELANGLHVVVLKKDDVIKKNYPFNSLNVNKKSRLFACLDFVSLKKNVLIARNLFCFFTENNPVQGTGKK